jgi:hypothetical protein
LRTLCIGIGKEGNPNYSYYSAETSLPTIFDYERVLLDLRPFYESKSYVSLSGKREEFKRFFESGGNCFVISEKYDKWSSWSNYDWCPLDDMFSITNVSGNTLICTEKKAKFLFDSFNFTWNHFFSIKTKDCKVLATNRTNDPISFVAPFYKGNCVFLPTPSNVVEFPPFKLLDFILNRGMELIPEVKNTTPNGTPTSIPPWANSIASQKELTLLESYNKLEEKLGKYSKFKQLYWESGEQLEDLVIDALRELGLKVTKLEKGSHVDLEVSLSGGLVAVCEVKGLNGSANLQDLRQLLDYYVEQRDIEQRNVKGVLFINHFRGEEPSKRGTPVTKEALDLVQRYNFQIITTIELYKILEKHISEGGGIENQFL